MAKYIGIFIAAVVTSLFYFPFEITGLPGLNTKMMMAAVGLVLIGYRLVTERVKGVNRDILTLSLWGGIVSFIGLFSITYNNTPDSAYAGYIISMWVWLSAAYVVCSCIRAIHGYLSVSLLCRYLMVVCVFQCIAALVIDSNDVVKAFVDRYVQQGQGFLNLSTVNRLYGIGANLDVAGVRFSAVLIMIAYELKNADKSTDRKFIASYVLAFIFIGVVGNIIARTTTVGLAIAIIYLILTIDWYHIKDSFVEHKFFISWMFCILLISVPIIFYLYLYNSTFTNYFRFAFEGFFSLIEYGEWSVASNDKLLTMYVFPESIKTWIIGDGYFSSPRDVDPYFIGKIVGGYYMGTDVGYLRLIFYFGVVGLMAFSAVIIKAAAICMRKFRNEKPLFIMLLMVNFIVWFKVATDIFLVFALFLMIGSEENDEYNKERALEV